MIRIYCDRCGDVKDGTPGWDRLRVDRTTEDFEEQYQIDLCPACVDLLLAWASSPHPTGRHDHDGETKAVSDDSCDVAMERG